MRAQAMSEDLAIPLGAIASYPIPGSTALLRAEAHLWARDEGGALTEGCFRATGIYLPVPPRPDTMSRTAKVVTALTVTSLALGIASTLAAWRKRKARTG